MRWENFEEATKAYQAVQEVKAAKDAKEYEEYRRKNLLEQEKRENQELARVKGILEKFHANEILEMIRDEIWKEGEIEEFEDKNWSPYKSIRRKGLRLVSDPIHVVVLKNAGVNLSVELEVRKAALEISTLTPDSNKKATIMLNSSAVYRVEDGEKFSVITSVKDLGLEEGLKKSAIIDNYGVYFNTKMVGIDEEEAADKFNDLVVRSVNERRYYKSVPKDIRNWGERIISVFPSELEETGKLGARRLRNWGHDIQESSVIYRGADRVANLVGIGLKV